MSEGPEGASVQQWTNQIHHGNSLDVLKEIPEESVHAVVTDPPYGLAFMGRDWDDFEPREYQDWCGVWAYRAMQALKPGGHLLAFSGNRTHHRLFAGVEDAGFEIRDTITWHYGSGFPKASDLGKSIDRRKGQYDNREFVQENPDGRRTDAEEASAGKTTKTAVTHPDITKPATEGAKRWDGWKTALKPATEYVVVARKPFDGATVDCVLEHGTGALNIDGCRIESDEDIQAAAGGVGGYHGHDGAGYEEGTGVEYRAGGRYPSNVVFDEVEAERLDDEVGELETGELTPEVANNSESNPAENCYGEYDGRELDRTYEAASGGPSRYFYTSKATKAERTLDGQIENTHPTVKPQDLMEWLVKLATREDQIVLDPFVGSGTTCRAAKELGRRFIGIEKQARWVDVARVRCGLTPDDPANVRPDDDQAGLEAYTDGGNHE